jgi:hypothetical protein
MITSKNQSWDSIIEHYESLIQNKWEVKPMLELVMHIVSNYSNKLYAYTSLDALIISIYERIDRVSETLHVKYDQNLKKFSFSYFGGYTASSQPEWQRLYNSEEGIKKFDEFIKMINW